jgi:NADH dehydrogenase FAD-containing subunit
MTPEQEATLHIVVLGGGYAGLTAANLAARWTGAQVTLVNERDRFVERVQLHQLAVGRQIAERPLAGMLARSGARLVVDRVTAIDPAAKRVRLAGGDALDYDLLVYALGSGTDLDSVEGAAEHAYSVAGWAQAQRLRTRLATAGRTVAVVGGGLTGVETVTEIAESHPGTPVRLVTGEELGAGLSRRGRAHLRRVLDRLGVEVVDRARVVKVGADGLLLGSGEHVAADTVVWTAGFQVPELAAEAGLQVEASGRISVDETLRSVSHPDVYAVGDAAAARLPSGQVLRMACATGLPMAQQAVRAMADRLHGVSPRPLRYRFVQQCISLGRRDGLIQFVRADDSPVEAVLTGRFAAGYKTAILRGVAWLLRHPTVPTTL